MSDVMALEYKQATAADLDEVMVFLSREFYPRENLCKGVGEDGTSSKTKMHIMTLSKCLASGVSVVARDKATGSVIGVRSSSISKRNFEAKMSKEEPQYGTENERKIYTLLERAKDLYDVFQDPEVDSVLEFDRLCVDSNYCKRGVAKKMVEMSINLATKKGCQLACSLVTSPYSEKLFLRLGFEIKAELDMRKQTDLMTTSDIDFSATKVMVKRL